MSNDNATRSGSNLGRAAKGTVWFQRGSWFARITNPDGTRKAYKLPGLGPLDRTKAEELAASMTRNVRNTPAALQATPQQLSVDGYWSRYIAYRLTRGLKSITDDEQRYRTHIQPVFGSMELAAVSPLDVRQFVNKLDDMVRSGSIAGNTALRIWTVVGKLFDEAVNSKDDALRVLKVDPTDKVRGPDRVATDSKQYLWPSEFTALMSNTRCPLWFRREVALAVYSYTRLGEMAGLEWGDIDFTNGVFHIQRSIETSHHRGAGRIKTIKGATAHGRRSRRVKMEPCLKPVLEAMRQECLSRLKRDGVADPNSAIATQRVMRSGYLKKHASLLREWLIKTGNMRGELTTQSMNTRVLTWHDLRATGITWCAVRGDDDVKIMYRAGHSNFSTTQMYIREAEALGELFGDVFPSLPSELSEVYSADDE